MLNNFDFMEQAITELEALDGKPDSAQLATIRITLTALLRDAMQSDDRWYASQSIDEA